MTRRARRLSSLPTDILLSIANFISVSELLSLKQTCRRLYRFGCTDYVWHQLVARLPIPLDIPFGTGVNSLAARDLQQIVLRALRLEYNFCRSSPQIRSLHRACNAAAAVNQMCLLPGAKWLLTLSREGIITLWSMRDARDVYRVEAALAPECWRFDAALDRGGQTATVVVFSKSEDGWDGAGRPLMIYNFRLKQQPRGKHTLPNSPKLVSCVPPPVPFGHFVAASVCDNLVAASMMEHAAFLQVLVLNTSTGLWTVVRPQYPRGLIPQPYITLYPRHISIMYHSSLEYLVQLQELPAKVLDSTAQNQPPDTKSNFEELSIITEQRLPVRVPNKTLYCSQARPYSWLRTRYDTDCFFEFGKDSAGICLKPRLLRFSIDFNTLDGTSTPPRISPFHESCALHAPGYGQYSVDQHPPQLGVTGRRAVWIERVPDTDYFTLMKMASMPETGAATFDIGVLLLGSELPFDLGTSSSTAFEEVTGRLCVGLHNGDVYVIDF